MADTTKTEVTTTVTIADLIPGNPPALVTVKRAVNSQGNTQHLTQKIFIRDADLARRLFAEVQRGDEVTLTLTTTWTTASYETDLSGFALPLRPKNTARQTAAVSP